MNEKSIEYWQKREKKWQEECQKEDQQWQKDLMKVYEELGAEIQEEIERFLLRYASAEGVDMRTAQQMLDSTDMKHYAALAKKYCTQAAKDMENGTYAQDDSKEYFTEQANAEMRRYNARMKISRLRMLESQLSLKILAAQSKTNAIVETAAQKRAMEEFTRQAGILGKTVLDNMDDVDTLIHASFHGATFSDRIWGPHQEQLQKKLQKALRNSLILGQGLQPFVRELHKELGVTKRQAARLLGTELTRVQVQANLLSIKESGFEEFTFIAAAGCCKDCQEANGEHYKVDDAKDGLNLPPVHPNCRCTIAPYMGRDDDDGFDEEVFDEWSESYEEHGLSWEEWKKQRSKPKVDFMGQAFTKEVGFGKGSYKFHQADKDGLFYTQTNSKCAQKTLEGAKKVLSGFGKDLKLDGVYVMHEKNIPGLAAYDHDENVLYLNQKLFEDGIIDEYQKTPGYFAARTGEETLIHELSHKKHWDEIKAVKNSDPVKYANIEIAKERVETELRKYVVNQTTTDPLYVSRTVSGNADYKFDFLRELNELIADANVLKETGRLSDPILAQLIENILT